MAIINFDKKLECNDEFVSLRLIAKRDEISVGGILLTEKAHSNGRLAHYQIEAIGKKAAEEYGLKVGDYVLADRLSVFFDSAPICVMRYTNIIVKTNEDMTKHTPLRNMLFVKQDDEKIVNVGGLLVNNYENALHSGTVIDVNIDEDKDFKLSIGDKIILTKKFDVIKSYKPDDKDLLIYKYDSVIAKVVD